MHRVSPRPKMRHSPPHSGHRYSTSQPIYTSGVWLEGWCGSYYRPPLSQRRTETSDRHHAAPSGRVLSSAPVQARPDSSDRSGSLQAVTFHLLARRLSGRYPHSYSIVRLMWELKRVSWWLVPSIDSCMAAFHFSNGGLCEVSDLTLNFRQASIAAST